MKICVAQTRPVAGDIETNIEHHCKFIARAIPENASLIVFPELSLTGYEPTLAGNLAMQEDDPKLRIFQKMADAGQVTIGVGAPVKSQEGVCISLLLFQPDGTRYTYSKKYLHHDEEPFFVSGRNSPDLLVAGKRIAFAICYEISIASHSKGASERSADVYVASVAKSRPGVGTAWKTLSAISKEYSMAVLMSNCTGTCSDFESAGCSAAWNAGGGLSGQLNDHEEALLILDTSAGVATKIRL